MEQSNQIKFKKFDVNELNKISIADFLEKRGFIKKNANSTYGMYLASWRGDRAASLKVDYAQNRWYDFGISKGGTIIDLVKEMYRVDFVDACKMLCDSDTVGLETQAKPQKETPKIKVLQEKPVSHFALKTYLTGRGIDRIVAMVYLKEIEFTIADKGKTYFGLGFRNDSEGYEIRNEFFKGCSGKDITTVDKSLSNCNVFEGFFDFLSYETLCRRFPKQYPPANALILNSTALAGRNNVKDFLEKHKTINCYLDNNLAGKQAFARLNETTSNPDRIKDCSSLYAGYEDLNNFLENNYKISQAQHL